MLPIFLLQLCLVYIPVASSEGCSSLLLSAEEFASSLHRPKASQGSGEQPSQPSDSADAMPCSPSKDLFAEFSLMVSHRMKLPLKCYCRSEISVVVFILSSTKDKVKHSVESKKTSKEKGKEKKKQTLCIKHFRVLKQHIREQRELSGSYLAVVAIVNVVLFHY